MQFRGMSRSHLFLIELIIAVLFFSFAGAITVQVFSRAHDLAESTTALNGAVIAAQTAAETDKTALFENIGAARDTVYFNRDWEITKKPEAVYNMTSDVNLEEREAGHYGCIQLHGGSIRRREDHLPASREKILFRGIYQ